MLFEQHIPQMLYAQSRFRYGELTGKKLKDELECVRDVLKEAVDILKLEEPTSPEGSIAVTGAESLKQLEESIRSVKVWKEELALKWLKIMSLRFVLSKEKNFIG